MNEEMSITKDTIWDEKNLIEAQKTSDVLTTLGECDITGNISKKNENGRSPVIIKTSGIYKIINRVNGKYYVGSSANIEERWKTHSYELNKNIHKNDHLQRAWNKYGGKNFHCVIVQQVLKEELLNVENAYLFTAKNEQHISYNLKFIAMGGELSDYSKKKLSISTSGHRNGMFGKRHTIQAKEKVSIANTGRCPAPEIRIKFGHPGSKNPKYNPTIYTFRNLKNNETYTGTIHNFYTKYNLLPSAVSHLIHNKRKSTSKWILSLT